MGMDQMGGTVRWRKRQGTVRQAEMMAKAIRAWMVPRDGFLAEKTPSAPVAMKANPLMTVKT